MNLSLTKYLGVDPLWSFPVSWAVSSDWPNSKWTPSSNFFEKEGKYYIETELPGVNKEDVSVSVEDGFITISGKREIANEQSDKNYYVKESSYGSFIRTFRVPGEVDEGKMKAEFKNGVLTVELPKKEKIKETKKKIEVK